MQAPTEILAKRGVASAVAFGSGAVLVLAFAPFDFWPFALVAAGGLYAAWSTGSAASLAFRGYLFGLAKYLIGVSWIYVSIHDHGHADTPGGKYLTSPRTL